MTGVAESPARWVLVDGRAHLLAGEHPRGVLLARCGHPLSRGVLRLPSRELCVTCLSAHLLPESVFSLSRTPARPPVELPRFSAPGGRPVPPLRKGDGEMDERAAGNG